MTRPTKPAILRAAVHIKVEDPFKRYESLIYSDYVVHLEEAAAKFAARMIKDPAYLVALKKRWEATQKGGK